MSETKGETRNSVEQLTPPQPRALAKSFPVPRGSTPTAGGGENSSWSRMESTQPTVPSPPQANTLRLGTLRNISNLRAATNEPERFIRQWERKKVFVLHRERAALMRRPIYDRGRSQHWLCNPCDRDAEQVAAHNLAWQPSRSRMLYSWEKAHALFIHDNVLMPNLSI